MFLTRVFGRRLFTTARPETSAAGAAAASTVRTAHNPLEEFFEADRNPEEDKPVVYVIWPITLSPVLSGPACIGLFNITFLGLSCSRSILAIPLFIGGHLIPHSGVIMFLTRVFGRRLFTTARPETSAAGAAAASTVRTAHNPLEEFFEADRNPEEDKPVVYGRSWKATELRLKSWDDLHKLWYVLLKEKNMLMSQRQMLHAQNLRFPNPERLPKVRKSMCRIKHVLTERAIEDPDPRRTAEMKRMINAL